MNDRFKFRAWNKDIKTMHEVESVYPYKDEYTQGGEVFLEGFKTSYYFPEQVELMQCTGLKDKNGKLIFEGDIVKQDGDNFEIKYCEKCKSYQCFGRVSWVKEKYCYACEDDYIWSEFIEGLDKAEVIGNIYENKELLQ